MNNPAAFQLAVDRMLGGFGRAFGRPFAVYRLGSTSTGDFPTAWQKLAQSFPVHRDRISGKLIDQNLATERTLWYQLTGDMSRFKLGDVFVSSDGNYAPGQAYGPGATSVPGTTELDGFALAYHGLASPPYGGRVDHRVGIYRPLLTPENETDGSTRWDTTHDADTPLVLTNGKYAWGTSGGVASFVPCGLGSNDRPGIRDEFGPDKIGIPPVTRWMGYLPPLPGYDPNPGDVVVTEFDARYTVVSAFRTQTGVVGSQLLLDQLISQSG